MMEEDREEFERLVILKNLSMKDKRTILKLSRTYINEGCFYCLTCDVSVRQMFNNFKKWYNEYKK